ncbi:MAG: CDP-diacylglycerol--serine O-phosphatidyltransferase [Gemmatimonadales bacterium]|nr:MAG: CDP-diacylglycerol--serine O-phosphatidyltransferase [Gemmatimonadales bacterium]
MSDRAGLQRGIIVLPSAFTLGNLFFGLYAIVAASRGDFMLAGWFIVFAAILDMLDGRIARFTRTGSRFGAELDSLVDAISFGVAPAFVLYHLFLADQSWAWILSFLYVAAAVVRLARFNVEQGGEAKRAFHGLPSPTAGMILATIYPFFTAPRVAEITGGLPSVQVVGVIMIAIAVLMMSHIPYQLVPRVGFRGWKRGGMTLFLAASAVAAIAIPQYFIFPFLVAYTAQGVARSFVLGLLERLPEQDPLLDEVDDGLTEKRTMDYGELTPRRYPPPDGEAPGETPETEPESPEKSP